MEEKSVHILAIESSCDDTGIAIIKNDTILSNIIATQKIHEQYGGVVPELASRAHQQNIIPSIDLALKTANKSLEDIDAVAFTRGPGLLGSLLVGTSFAKGLSLGLSVPLIEVNHMQAHILSHFIKKTSQPIKETPNFPFICLTVSGGHTQLVMVRDYNSMEIIGETIDDAAGEAFDKAAKIMGLPYPGGPLIDKYAKEGNPETFTFARPKVDGNNFSFSGLKTSFLYFLNDRVKEDRFFIEKYRNDLCASLQKTIVTILIDKLKEVVELTGVKEIALAGGVSANSGLRNAMIKLSNTLGCKCYIPDFEFCTDNAAMIAMAGYYKYIKADFCSLNITPQARYSLNA